MDIIALKVLRFQELAEAYGADIGRWPAIDQAPAMALIVADPEGTRAPLALAAELDAWLDESPEAAPSPWVVQAITASAPRPSRAGSARRWRIGLGAGLATASVAGILAGAAAAPLAVSHLHGPTVDTASEAASLLGEPRDAWEG